MTSIPYAIKEMQGIVQWVNYIYLQRGQTRTKPPINPHIEAQRPLKERFAQVNDPTTWGTYAQAAHRYRVSTQFGYQGVGFMFSADDPYCGIDCDHCRDIETGELTEWVQHAIRLLNSYTEISPSGKGIHIIVRASTVTLAEHLGVDILQHKDMTREVELYDRDRYFTMTGKHLGGTPTTIEQRQDALDALYVEVFGSTYQKRQSVQQQTTEPGQPLPENTELIALASAARDGRGLRFQRLWAGDTSDFRTASGDIDESRADQALLGILAYWTGKDASKMEDLFKESGLYSGKPDRQRKWDAPARSGETYGEGSIRTAIDTCTSTYNPDWRPTGWVPYEEYIARKRQQRTKKADDGDETTSHRLELGKQTFPHDASYGEHYKGRLRA